MRNQCVGCWAVSLLGPWLCSGAVVVHAVEIIAHRGASSDAPENTVASAKLGYEQGADAVECDIYLTKDGKLAVIHDPTTKRTTGVEGKVADMTLAELQALDAGKWKGGKFAGEKIPTLDELLAAVPNGKGLVIEVKCNDKVIPELKATLQRANKKAVQILLICFDAKTLQAIKKELPQHKALWLAGYEPDKKTGKLPLDLDARIERSKAAGFAGLNLSSGWPIDAAFVQKVHDAGLQLYVWTVDDAPLARRLAQAGVDGITTNRPGWLRKELGK